MWNTLYVYSFYEELLIILISSYDIILSENFFKVKHYFIKTIKSFYAMRQLSENITKTFTSFFMLSCISSNFYIGNYVYDLKQSILFKNMSLISSLILN